MLNGVRSRLIAAELTSTAGRWSEVGSAFGGSPKGLESWVLTSVNTCSKVLRANARLTRWQVQAGCGKRAGGSGRWPGRHQVRSLCQPTPSPETSVLYG